MRTLQAALQVAVATLGSQPDIALELADIWPHFATVGGVGASGPVAGVTAPDGSVVFAVVVGGGPAGLQVQRSATPGDSASWSAPTTITANADPVAGICLTVSGSTVRLLWRDATGGGIMKADSGDNGQTWGVAAALFTVAHATYGIACAGDLNTIVIAYDVVGLGNERLAYWHNSGGWTGTDWTNPEVTGMSGLAMVADQASGYFVVLSAQSGPSSEAYSLQACALTVGGGPTWGAPYVIVPVDTSAGVYVSSPHLAYFGGLYRLSYLLGDTGTSSGSPYMRCARTSSADFVHFAAPLEDSASQPNGAAWLQTNGGAQVLLGALVRHALANSPSTNYLDLSGDLLKLDLTEREGQPARLVATLDNKAGAYTNLVALRPNAQLQLSQGYVGAGRVATHLLYVDE